MSCLHFEHFGTLLPFETSTSWLHFWQRSCFSSLTSSPRKKAWALDLPNLSLKDHMTLAASTKKLNYELGTRA
jgi:hypothetical protein